MITVHKHVLTEVLATVSTFEGAKVIHVGNQRDRITVWLEVNTTEPGCVRTFVVVATGEPVPNGTTHVGSVILRGGDCVFHIYEHDPVAVN